MNKLHAPGRGGAGYPSTFFIYTFTVVFTDICWVLLRLEFPETSHN